LPRPQPSSPGTLNDLSTCGLCWLGRFALHQKRACRACESGG
jgi:hypothetical protein